MKNIVIICTTGVILIIAIIVGMQRGIETVPSFPKAVQQDQNIPFIGKIQVLNGCGTIGAANVIAEYLRENKFDVKNIGNAPMANYQTTLVVSRQKDMTIAKQVANALITDAVFLMRNGDDMYNVTVYVGADYKERVR